MVGALDCETGKEEELLEGMGNLATTIASGCPFCMTMLTDGIKALEPGILARANRTRGYGDYYHYHRLAAGQLDAVVESDVNILDIAALVVIVREAGGVFTDLAGRSPDLSTTTVLAATPALHGRLLGMLAP